RAGGKAAPPPDTAGPPGGLVAQPEVPVSSADAGQRHRPSRERRGADVATGSSPHDRVPLPGSEHAVCGEAGGHVPDVPDERAVARPPVAVAEEVVDGAAVLERVVRDSAVDTADDDGLTGVRVRALTRNLLTGDGELHRLPLLDVPGDVGRA